MERQLYIMSPTEKYVIFLWIIPVGVTFVMSHTAHPLRSIYRLATSFNLVYRSSSSQVYKNKYINRK